MLPPEAGDIVEEIAALLRERRDPAWAEVAVEMGFADGFSQLRTWFRLSYDAEWQPTGRYADCSAGFAELFSALRRLMYREDRGTWFSARATVTDHDEYRADYDFDNKPRFDPPAPADVFVKDLREFPRPPERVPAWVTELG